MKNNNSKNGLTWEMIIALIGVVTACIGLGWQIIDWRANKKKEAPNLQCECTESFYSVLDSDKENGDIKMVAFFGVNITNQSSNPDWIKFCGTVDPRRNPGAYTKIGIEDPLIIDYLNKYDIGDYYMAKHKIIFDENFKYADFIKSHGTWYTSVPVRVEPYEIKKSFFIIKVDQTSEEIKDSFDLGCINTRGMQFLTRCEAPTKVELIESTPEQP